jgi:hypothetical protein
MKSPKNDQQTKQHMRFDGVFRKSSASGTNGCVEVAKSNDIIRVRDSKNTEGSVLTFTHTEWIAFLKGVKNDEFEV